jgi:hypothetical protein
VYVNDVQTLQVSGDTDSDGSPGMGFDLQEYTRRHDDYWVTSFEASD